MNEEIKHNSSFFIENNKEKDFIQLTHAINDVFMGMEKREVYPYKGDKKVLLRVNIQLIEVQ